MTHRITERERLQSEKEKSVDLERLEIEKMKVLADGIARGMSGHSQRATGSDHVLQSQQHTQEISRESREVSNFIFADLFFCQSRVPSLLVS